MSRKLSEVDFARIWGEVSKLSQKRWDALVALRAAHMAAKPFAGTKREPRKPRGGPAEGEKP